ncbi:conjugal transfer protein TraO [Bacteroides thetaiotaomicron]|nr:conjugal transfer protein TraO [Bacteroides thetaiotaomicron]MCS2278615.1 conjugal transfer protein TraO [Bacteroides thetaiotaomicron]
MLQPGKPSDAGYAFSLAVSTCTGRGDQWMFGGEMLKRNIPYRITHIPLSQYTGGRRLPPYVLSTPRKSAGFLGLGGFRPVGL